MHDERRTRERGLLPIEARRILWDRLWARLLAPPPETGGEGSGCGGGSSNPAAQDSLTGEGGR
ncbi:MAG: hypothetical protein M3Q03_03110 [Chloroflexota bacterium]|nr:hypothetical protein [Chloroflexota bacterium]